MKTNLKSFLSIVSFLSIILFSLPAQAMTDFYVDPDWSGAQTGASDAPWTWPQWNTINSILQNDDVTVFFSAREAGSDTNETSTTRLEILRTDTSSNRLTLDGMSKYNTSDSNPSWSNYNGSSKFQITSEYTIHTGTGAKRSYVTVRGFRAINTGNAPQVIYWVGGDQVIIEYIDALCLDNAGGIYLASVLLPDNPSDGFTIRNCSVDSSSGEAIYIAGGWNKDYTAHKNILIENNVVINPGDGTGQSDAIDLKDGHQGVIIRGNTLFMPSYGGNDGIVTMSAALIENNFIYNFGRRGIGLGTYWNIYSNGARDGSIIRNNIIVNCKNGIEVTGKSTGDNFTNTKILNNTIIDFGVGNGILINSPFSTDVVVINNITSEGDSYGFRSAAGTLAEHNNNLYYDSDGGNVVVYGSASYNASNITDFESGTLSVDPQFVKTATPYVAGNFKVLSGSPAIDAGTYTSYVTIDFENIPRPANPSEWDIGAYEQSSGAPSAPTPTGFQIVP